MPRGSDVPRVRMALRVAVRAGAWLGLIGVLALCVLTLAPRALGWSPVVVRSGSMGPAVPVGSLVVVRPVTADAVTTGQPVVVQRSGTAVLHRVVALVERHGRRFAQLRGDANPVPDPELDPLDGPLATPVVVVPVAGFAVALLSALTAPILTVGAGVLAISLVLRGRGSRARD